MKKFFTFFAAALLSVSMFANQVVISSSEFTVGSGQSIVKDDITFVYAYPYAGNLLGNLTCPSGFEITEVLVSGSNLYDLSINSENANPWQGSSTNVAISCDFQEDITILCTYEGSAPQVTTHTLKLVSNDETMGSVAVTNLLGSGIIDNGDGTYAVPEGVQATVLATPKEGYQFALWRYSEKLNDFNDNCYYCGRLVYDLPLANPWTINALTEDEAILAIFEEAAPSDPNVATWGTGFLSYINAYRKEVHGGENVNKDNVKDGITAFYEGTRNSDGLSWGQMYVTGGVDSKLIFSHESRKFTKIEIYGVLTQYSTTAFNDWAWNAEIGAFVWEGEPTDSVIVQSTNGSEKISMVGLKRIVFSLEHSTEAISNTAANVNAVKVVRNGQIFILKNGKTFNALGAEVK